MKVKELISELSKLPPESTVRYIYDGSPYGYASLVWLAKNGQVMICDYNESVYTDRYRPENSPEDKYWTTEQDPNQPDDDLSDEYMEWLSKIEKDDNGE